MSMVGEIVKKASGRISRHGKFRKRLAKSKKNKKEIGNKIMPIPICNLRVGTVTDAAWGNALELPEDPSAKKGASDRWEETET